MRADSEITLVSERWRQYADCFYIEGEYVMKYKNIVFDFGNVIGKFDGRYMLRQYFPAEADYELIFSTVFRKWNELDAGTVDYWEYAKETASLLPGELAGSVDDFFRGWPEHVTLFEDTLNFIDELKECNIPVYLLSNASTYFADWVLERYAFLEKFSGIVFSAPLKMAKPDPCIYQYLFDTYRLDPKECFFLDDLEKNINAGRALGMDGLVFDGNIEKVKDAIGF